MAARTKVFKPVDDLDTNESNYISPCHHTTKTIFYSFSSKNYFVT